MYVQIWPLDNWCMVQMHHLVMVHLHQRFMLNF